MPGTCEQAWQPARHEGNSPSKVLRTNLTRSKSAKTLKPMYRCSTGKPECRIVPGLELGGWHHGFICGPGVSPKSVTQATAPPSSAHIGPTPSSNRGERGGHKESPGGAGTRSSPLRPRASVGLAGFGFALAHEAQGYSVAFCSCQKFNSWRFNGKPISWQKAKVRPRDTM